MDLGSVCFPTPNFCHENVGKRFCHFCSYGCSVDLEACSVKAEEFSWRMMLRKHRSTRTGWYNLVILTVAQMLMFKCYFDSVGFDVVKTPTLIPHFPLMALLPVRKPGFADN